MSCSKPLPPFVYDSLDYLNRDQLERFLMVCFPLKNFIKRYFHSKPYRVFNRLNIRGGSFALRHNRVQWHPNRDDYSVQQFLAGQKCSVDESKLSSDDFEYYSFAEMRPYLDPTIRIQNARIFVAGGSIFSAEHIEEMESIAYLWRDGNITINKGDVNTPPIWNADENAIRIVAEDFLPMFTLPAILQCATLNIINAYFSFKDYNVLYTMKVIILNYDGDDDTDSNYWPDFLEQPGLKPIVILHYLRDENIDKALDRLKEAFSSAVLPNAFKVIFAQDDESLTEFRKNEQYFRRKIGIEERTSTGISRRLFEEIP